MTILATELKPTCDASITHSNDDDYHTGFMASSPLLRLPSPWDEWEAILDAAVQKKLQLGDKPDLTVAEENASKQWRGDVRKMNTLSVAGLEKSEATLQRAHVVLTYILHFYIQTLPVSEPILVPRTISIPLLYVSQLLEVPPVITYADSVLNNWEYIIWPQKTSERPAADNLRSQTTFTGLVDEHEFNLVSARIEFLGSDAVKLIALMMDQLAVGDSDATKQITEHLRQLAGVIYAMKDALLDVMKRCNPDVFYNQVRPWLRGEDSAATVRKWKFEGIDEHPDLRQPQYLSGPSAGQSCLIHSLDAFFGIDHGASNHGSTSLMTRMQEYMPKKHREFLNNIKMSPRPLRNFVLASVDACILAEFNHAVAALKAFRDAHMIIITFFVLGPARRAEKKDQAGHPSNVGNDPIKGTGGTDLVKFLKETRAHTTAAMIDTNRKMD
ncbi:Indoleamine 2,3-dioxygenase 1 [Psilocybe cubensis]|uniref:Indoleamine 2,3-dioxygenase 1 n=2 Tax=Psilocybe cubensis TaxID=181762 RepID=A0ACB8H4H9_PSICU|nr:Indoleamine 2,3-dioxygenase 1 [Psilocybe cubensis]KAH9482090.1 Indoleamine 2,3-dioxygenase 1 [Psilocybe cubensis]